MKVYVFPSDEWGVGHYRMIWPARAVRLEEGVQVEVVPPGRDVGVGGWFDHRGVLTHAWGPQDADVVVMQRVTRAVTAGILRLLRKRGVATVVDVDDDLSCIDPANPAFSVLHPRRNANNNWTWLSEACMHASLVTCSTPALAKRYGGHGRVMVLENRVPRHFLDIPHKDSGGDDPLFGWAGDLPTHPRDLDPVGDGARRAGARFTHVGPPAGVGEKLGVDLEPGPGEVDFHAWLDELAKLDVGIAPLADSKFNAAKSWLKPLEYAAAGVPWVGSPAPEYRRLSATVPGLLPAGRSSAWAAALRSMKDPALRQEMSEAGRAAVAEHHTYEGNGWRWAEAWDRALADTIVRYK